jgi:hypothetical protein
MSSNRFSLLRAILTCAFLSLFSSSPVSQLDLGVVITSDERSDKQGSDTSRLALEKSPKPSHFYATFFAT